MMHSLVFLYITIIFLFFRTNISGKLISLDVKDKTVMDLSNNTNLKLSNTYFEDFDYIRVLILDNNTRISIIPKNAIFIQKKLTDLSLRSCGITVIFNVTFSELPSLTKLHLEDNKIVFIGADAFDRNPALQYLYLNNNQLERFNEANHLRNLQRLFFIDLSGNREFNFINNTIKHNLFTPNILFAIKCRDCNLVSIHKDMFHNWEYLMVIDFSCNNIKEVPENAFDALKHITLIDLSYNPIKKLQLKHPEAERLICVHCLITDIGDSLKDLPELHMIDFSHNSISFVPEDAFKHNPMMKRIVLNGNKLRTFSYQIVIQLGSLNKLCLDHNPIEANYETTQLQDIYIQRGLRRLCPNVSEPFETSLPRILIKNGIVLNQQIERRNCSHQRYISLANRDIIYLNPQHYKECDNLNSLSMSGNRQFEFLANRAFLESVSIQKYTCDMCNISDIYTESFSQLPHLRVLSLQYNSIQLLGKDIFDQNRDIRELYFEGNDIKGFDYKTFDHLPNLKRLSLGWNRNFKIRSHRVFLYHDSLAEFECNTCAIEKLTSTMFEYMPNLEVLQLDNNEIETIEVNTFRNNIHLRELSIDGNLIKSFSSHVIHTLWSLRVLCMDWKQYQREVKSEEEVTPFLTQIEETIKHDTRHMCIEFKDTTVPLKPTTSTILPSNLNNTITAKGLVLMKQIATMGSNEQIYYSSSGKLRWNNQFGLNILLNATLIMWYSRGIVK